MVFARRAQNSPEPPVGSDEMGGHPKWSLVNGSGVGEEQLGNLEPRGQVRESGASGESQ